jgi:hypothetical protein
MADDLSDLGAVPVSDNLSDLGAVPLPQNDPRAYIYGHAGNGVLPPPSPAVQKQIAQMQLASQPLLSTLRDEASATLGTGARIGLQAGSAVAGQMIGADSGIPGGQLIGGAVGAIGGNVASQALSNKPFSMGQVVEAGLMGAVPISPGGKTAVDVTLQAGKYAALGGAGKAAQISIDQGPSALESLDSVKQVGTAATVAALAAPASAVLDKGAGVAAEAIRKASAADMDASIAAATAAGAKVLPADTNPNPLTKGLQAIGGKQAMAQAAKDYNQEWADNLVRQNFGLPPGTPLVAPMTDGAGNYVPGTADLIRQKANQTYAQVAALGGNQGQAALKGWMDASKLANQYNAYANANAVKLDPAVIDAAKESAATYGRLADSYDEDLTQLAASSSDPTLVDQLHDARTTIAQSHILDKALVPGTGHVDPSVFGQIYDKNPALLTGDFYTLGRSANALSRVINSTQGMAHPGGTAQTAWESAAGALAGYNYAGLKGAVGGASLPLAHPAARAISFSGPFQKYLAMPSYSAPQADALARFAAQGPLQAPTAALLGSYTQPTQ